MITLSWTLLAVLGLASLALLGLGLRTAGRVWPYLVGGIALTCAAAALEIALLVLSSIGHSQAATQIASHAMLMLFRVVPLFLVAPVVLGARALIRAKRAT